MVAECRVAGCKRPGRVEIDDRCLVCDECAAERAAFDAEHPEDDEVGEGEYDRGWRDGEAAEASRNAARMADGSEGTDDK